MLKLNLGCGFDKRDGYVNIDFQDFHEPDVVADVRSLDQYLDATCDEIIAQDVLEHLERSEVAPALAEWARLLVEDGRLVLRVPDVLGVARLLAADADVERHDILLQNLFGTQAYSGDYHHAGFTELTLRSRLHDAGFVVETLEHRDEWLFDVVAVRRANPGPFDPGSLQYVRFGPDEATDEDVGAGLVGRVDRLAASVAERAPAPIRRLGQQIWRPLRRRLTRPGAHPQRRSVGRRRT